jgi:hypothetical protein
MARGKRVTGDIFEKLFIWSGVQTADKWATKYFEDNRIANWIQSGAVSPCPKPSPN